MKSLRRDELTQARASGRELPENLAEGIGLEFHLGDSCAFSGDAQKFNVHGVRPANSMGRNSMIAWGVRQVWKDQPYVRT
jgi:hypothetical protein